jgi:hypothetical protein
MALVIGSVTSDGEFAASHASICCVAPNAQRVAASIQIDPQSAHDPPDAFRVVVGTVAAKATGRP